MKILVQKYGGTSVATVESREIVYQKIIKAKDEGYSIVVVISAMGRRGAAYATDTLLDLIRLENPKANKRELDLIFSCGEIISGTLITTSLQQQGYSAVFLTGQQAGIITTPNFSDAKILEIDVTRIKGLLEKSNIVVVAGGQGATIDGQITTLGRGGSDTTACALGVALGAEEVEIYTDVDGILTTDPRIVPDARLLNEISYENCYQMAYQGAKVMHPRAVEIASQKPNMALYVRSVFNNNQGTLINSIRNKLPEGADLPEKGGPVGIALMSKQCIFKVSGLHQGQKACVLEALKSVHTQIHDIHPESDHMVLVMDEQDIDMIKVTLDEIGICGEWYDGLSKVSMIGENLIASSKTFADFLSAIESLGILIISTTMCNNALSAWINDKSTDAVKAVHKLL